MRRLGLKRNCLVGSLNRYSKNYFKRFYGDFFYYVAGYGVKLRDTSPPFSNLKDHIWRNEYNLLELSTDEYCYYNGCFDNYSILFSDLIDLNGSFSGSHLHGPYDEKEIFNPNDDTDNVGSYFQFLFAENKEYYDKINKFKEIVYSSNLDDKEEIKKNFGFYAKYIDC